MFIDEVEIKVIAGKGGDGALAFRREKFVPMGGPFGGNGGRGGDIYFEGDSGLKTLIDLRYQKLLKADNGENGKGKNQYGEDAKDLVIKVPLGTIVYDLKDNKVIADITKHGKKELIAKGGRGGRGNTAFKTQSNPAPNYSENGELGEEKRLKVELKLLADVGLVGLPNAGKSTILSKVSRAKPKIANYPFTTLSPNLGVVRAKDGNSFVLCDLPGLIEGASKGQGLGDRFLKHIERCRLIAHVIDMGTDNKQLENYQMINKELRDYSEVLANKKQIIIANKMDMPNALENLEEFKKSVDKEIFEVVAIKGEGLDEVILELSKILKTIEEDVVKEEIDDHVVYELEDEDNLKVYKDNEIFVVESDKLYKIYQMTNFNTFEANKRFMKKIKNLGVEEALKEKGIKEGDKVRIYDLEFIYKE